MPVFISYSHRDKEFAEDLARQLIARHVNLWLDRWEMNVGDSLTRKVQTAINQASALLVILSKASVESEWCKTEISAGLIRELDEKKVLVLPVFLEDCEIPLFLKDKIYADFRSNPDEGLESLLSAIASVTNPTMGRIKAPQYHIDWGVTYKFYKPGKFALVMTFVEQAVEQEYTCLTEITSLPDIDGMKYIQDIGERAGFELLDELVKIIEEQQITFRLPNSDPVEKGLVFYWKKAKSEVGVLFTVRRLGKDNGKDVLLDTKGQVQSIKNYIDNVLQRA